MVFAPWMYTDIHRYILIIILPLAKTRFDDFKLLRMGYIITVLLLYIQAEYDESTARMRR